MDNYFSIIIPVFNRQNTIGRAIRSVVNQSYQNWELIIINDGSTDGTQQEVSQYMKQYPHANIRMFITPENYGRLSARNFGMKVARNDWICWLDSDDEYTSDYLEEYNKNINKYKEYDIFNSGMLVKTYDKEYIENGYRIVVPFALEELATGMSTFDKGHIGSGSFVFRRTLLEDVGFFPEAETPYGGDDSLPAMWVQKDKRMAEICTQNENGQWLPLGNPWGDDYSYFWRLTREHKSKMINAILYIQHVRV